MEGVGLFTIAKYRKCAASAIYIVTDILNEDGWSFAWQGNEIGKWLPTFVMEVNIIGKIVTVTVDRAMGTYHPEHPNIYYPINYGYIKGIIAPDGEEQDAYILGVEYPLQEFTGKIIAIIHRYDDIEEKWVVAPGDMTFTKEEIRKRVHFQEQYFNIKIVV